MRESDGEQNQTVTVVVNGAPYGTEGPYNALRLVAALTSAACSAQVRIFLMADGVLTAKRGQIPPEGYYNTGKMLADLIEKGVTVRLCGTCCKARGLSQEDLAEGARITGVLELAKWVVESSKVVTF